MGLRDEFEEAVDSIRDFQFHATKVTFFLGLYYYSLNSLFFNFTNRLIGLRRFSKQPSVILEAHYLLTHFPPNQPSFTTLKELLKSSFQLSQVPNQDSLLTL